MNEILVPFVSGVVRSLLGLFEFLGLLLEMDFRLTDCFFSVKTLCALRDRVRRRKALRGRGR